MQNKSFKSQSYSQPVFKHKDLPIFLTKEFDFYRCVEFKETFYGKTASELFNGNLRICNGRYSSLFPNQKISYWADSPETARAEIKKHGAGNSILTFHGYDDASSFVSCLGSKEPLIIVDGRKNGIQELIDKADSHKEISQEERDYLNRILSQKIDCIVYDSKAYPGGENYLFLETGFKKLALRELKLRFSRQEGGSHASIVCAFSTDYTPCLEGYGDCFLHKCKIQRISDYLNTDEYQARLANVNKEYERIDKKRR